MILEVLGVLAAGGLIYGVLRSGNKGGSEKESRPTYSFHGEEPYLTQYCTYGDHMYRQKGEVAKVVLIHPKKRIVRTVIEDDGRINDFPGFEHPDLIAEYLDDVTDRPYVSFRSDFEKTDDGFLFRWQIQPDGRYWEDDGFGASNGAELILYAYLDDEGRFTSKFRIYSYGVTEYFGTDKEDIAAGQM